MKFAWILFLSLGLVTARADTLFDTNAIRDKESLEITVLQDWKISPKDPAFRQKLIEITVCQWWEGQKVRLPVTLNAPAQGGPCKNLVVANQGLAKRIAAPTGGQLDLLKNHGVGIVLIGMGTIDAMEPLGQLHLGMKRKLLETKNHRFTPAWIWGMSQMRALTAALTEPEVFQPEKVLTTGGSKRGVAAAVAGIHDDRFTAILPVVAPPLGNPGSPTYVIGTEPADLLEIDRQFYENLADQGVAAALRERAGRRADQQVTLEEAREAKWTDADIEAITDQVWDACRVTKFLPELEKRGLEIFYNVGTNDSVSPALFELGKRFPDFPICIIPGGQHGGPATAGFTRQTPSLPEIEANFVSFARHHFFSDRGMIEAPLIESSFDRASKTLTVTTTFPDGTRPEKNALWWNINRSKPYTLSYEYDSWETVPMKESGPGTFTAAVTLGEIPKRLDFLSLHTDVENDLPLTVSSPYRRIDFEKAIVALVGDSTVTDSAGWGKEFEGCFGENVRVHNLAVGGRSSKSWFDEGKLPNLRNVMPDFVLIQFGHNDQPGKGPKRETDPATTYHDHLKIYIDESRKIGATPILLSPVTRRDFAGDGTIRVQQGEPEKGATRSLKSYADAAKSLATEQHVAFVDLYNLSVALHNRIGPEESAAFSPKEGDITHFNKIGAKMIASLITKELKTAEPNLAAFLKE